LDAGTNRPIVAHLINALIHLIGAIHMRYNPIHFIRCSILCLVRATVRKSGKFAGLRIGW
jgi:hypothetical protein